MKRPQFCTIKTFLFAALVVFSLSRVTSAAAPPGSIALQLAGGAGVTVTVWRVADYTKNGYVLLPNCATSGVNLNALHTVKAQADAAKTLADTLQMQKHPGMRRVTGQDGRALFCELEIGVYLVTAAKTAPFLVALPMQSPDGKSPIYHVTAMPKSEPDTGGTPLPPPNGKLPQTGQNVQNFWWCLAAALCMLALSHKQFHPENQCKKQF